MKRDSIHNYQESAVCESVVNTAPNYPKLAGDGNLLADVACVALNALRPRYIRHDVDLHFFMTGQERTQSDAAVAAAVAEAFEFVGKKLDQSKSC